MYYLSLNLFKSPPTHFLEWSQAGINKWTLWNPTKSQSSFYNNIRVVADRGMLSWFPPGCDDWLAHSFHLARVFCHQNAHGLLPGCSSLQLLGARQVPGRKSGAKPEGVFVGLTHMPGGHAGVSHSFPLVAASQKVTGTGVWVQIIYRRLIESKLVL